MTPSVAIKLDDNRTIVLGPNQVLGPNAIRLSDVCLVKIGEEDYVLPTDSVLVWNSAWWRRAGLDVSDSLENCIVPIWAERLAMCLGLHLNKVSPDQDYPDRGRDLAVFRYTVRQRADAALAVYTAAGTVALARFAAETYEADRAATTHCAWDET